MRGQGDYDADGGGAAVDESRKDRPCEQAKSCITHLGHPLQKQRIMLERLHGLAHDLHAHKQQSESEQCVKKMAEAFGREKDLAGKSDRDQQKSVLGDLKRGKLGGEGRADIAAHDDGDALLHGHQARANEADQQHGCDGAALGECCGDRACEKPSESVGRKSLQGVAEMIASRSFQRLGQAVQSVQKDREAAKQPDQQQVPCDGSVLCCGHR